MLKVELHHTYIFASLSELTLKALQELNHATLLTTKENVELLSL